MIIKLFAVHDNKAKTFGHPFTKQSEIDAVRDFKRLKKDQNSTLCHYPDEFDLYIVSLFDTENGHMESINQKIEVENGNPEPLPK